jgi:hypothetical protein
LASTAAERDPAAMDALVYICAMMLPSGVSGPSSRRWKSPTLPFDAIVGEVHDGAATVVDPARGRAGFRAQLSAAGTGGRRAPAPLVAEPHGPRSEPLALDGGRCWGSLPRTYVECTADRTIPIASQRRMQAMSPRARAW